MRYSTSSQYLLGDTTPAESFGRISRSAEGPRRIAQPDARSANEADIMARDAGTGASTRALVANGLSEAAVETSGAFARLSDIQLDEAARALRSRVVGQLISGALQSVRSRFRRLLAELQRRREERATCRALLELDTGALRDIGLDRSEIWSAARELSEHHATRVHALLSARGRS
jgi:uncharacterized protein YjiS (DUF1127 family)